MMAEHADNLFTVAMLREVLDRYPDDMPIVSVYPGDDCSDPTYGVSVEEKTVYYIQNVSNKYEYLDTYGPATHSSKKNVGNMLALEITGSGSDLYRMKELFNKES